LSIDAQGISLGYLDDTCDGLIEATVNCSPVTDSSEMKPVPWERWQPVSTANVSVTGWLIDTCIFNNRARAVGHAIFVAVAVITRSFTAVAQPATIFAAGFITACRHTSD
jgi:hypothetical protein